MKTRKKGFQIILPSDASDVNIALCGTHGSRVIAVTAYLFLFSRGKSGNIAKLSPEAGEGETVLSV